MIDFSEKCDPKKISSSPIKCQTTARIPLKRIFCSPCLHRPGENMDNTIIQEASASENMNGDIDATPECAADVPADVTATTAPAVTETKSYDDLFPSLPTSAPGPATGGPASIGGQWNRKPVLASSTVTQVSYLNTFNLYKCHVASTYRCP